jgi:c-di-GMP-binding flagellar brake protein YcgR
MSSLSLSSFPIAGSPKEKKRYIREMLTFAKDSRAHIFMDFSMHNKVLFQLKGSCQEVEDDRMFIYLREEIEELPLAGMQVNVYFSLRSNRKPMPFNFTTTLLDTEQHNRDVFLVLDMPESMAHQQRRYNVRINVQKEDIDNFKIWFGTPGKASAGESGKTHWTPMNPDHVEIYDISAGGMQIGISKESPIHPLLSRQSTFLISGTFFVKGKEASPLVMASNTVRLQHDSDLPFTVLGVSYQQWAKVSNEGLQWVNMTTQDGIAPLASWVFQAIMDRFKVDRSGD